MYCFVPFTGKLYILEVYSVSTVYHLLPLEVVGIMEATKVTDMVITVARNASMELIPWGL
jgi:hypothetical protein